MKTKTIFFTLTLVLFSLFCSSQTTDFTQKYKELIKQAESFYNSKDYKKSFELFQQAFKLENKNPNHLYNGACNAALSGDKKNAFTLLELAIQNGYTDMDNLRRDTDLESLHNNNQWPVLIEKIEKKVDEIESNYDKPLQKELLGILAEDQAKRNEYSNAVNKFGYHNPTVDSLAKIVNYKDSINVIKVSKILDERGWVGKDKVGEQANQALFLVIQHSDLKTQERYLPMAREAVKEGNLPANFLALLEDRVAIRQGKKQIYGSQIHQNQKTKEWYIAPLEDPDNVDKRRAEVGLGILSDYAKPYNIDWNVEEYKKQLPELELLDQTK